MNLNSRWAIGVSDHPSQPHPTHTPIPIRYIRNMSGNNNDCYGIQNTTVEIIRTLNDYATQVSYFKVPSLWLIGIEFRNLFSPKPIIYLCWWQWAKPNQLYTSNLLLEGDNSDIYLYTVFVMLVYTHHYLLWFSSCSCIRVFCINTDYVPAPRRLWCRQANRCSSDDFKSAMELLFAQTCCLCWPEVPDFWRRNSCSAFR